MASQADRNVALALIKEVEDQVKQHGENILFSDPSGNWYRELLKQCKMAENQAPDDREVLLSSTLAEINLELAMGGAASPLYDRALGLVDHGSEAEAMIRFKHGVYLSTANNKGKVDKQNKQKAIQNFERAMELYGANSPKGIECATRLVKVKAMEEESSGCFIASAAYGSSFTPEVMAFRRFRDEVLLPSKLGTAFVKLYYFVTPPLATVMERSWFLKAAVRRFLLEPVLRMLKMTGRFGGN